MDIRRLIGFVGGFLLVTHCGTHSELKADATLAQINDKTITLDYFKKKYQENLQFFQYQTPSQKNVLDDMIKREIGIQEAKKLGLDKDPDIIEKMNTVLYHAFLEKTLSKEFEKIQISNEEAREYYKENPEIRTSHIFVSAPLGAPQKDEEAALTKIKSIQDNYLKKGMNFAEVSQRYSEGTAAPMGGDIDYQTKDKLDPAYYDAAIKLKSPGNISGIVRSQFGFHIIKLTAIRPWEKTDKAKIKRLVFAQQREKIFENYMKKLQGTAKIQVNYSLLK